MFTWMRTHQRKLMLVITILTIVSFVCLYSIHDPSRLQNDEALRIYDRNISYSDFQRTMRKFNLALSLGLIDYASELSGGGQQGAPEFALNTMILEHEGRRLGIRPDDQLVADAITTIPAFQTSGQFDPSKYETVYQRDFAPNGFTRSEIDEIVRNSMIFDRLKKVLDSAPAVTSADVGYFSRALQPVSGAAIVFSRDDFTKNAAPTEQQISDYFKANAANFLTPEWRTARYVRFPLPAGLDKLQGKAKIEAQQKVATASDDFSQHAAAAGFEKAAREGGLQIETTLPFDRSGNIRQTPVLGTSATNVVGPVQALATTVFTLSTKDPVSRVIESGNEFLVAALADVTASRPMTLEEARPQIVQQLTEAAAQTALGKMVTDALAKLRGALKAGKPFAEAAAAAGVKTTPFTGLSLASETTPADQRKLAEAAVVLNENEISGFRPEAAGGFAVWVEKRLPLDSKKFDAQKKEIESAILSQRKSVLFNDWLDSAKKESGVSFSNNGRG